MAQTHAFAGDIPEKYDRYLGPILFEPYAKDLARRIPKAGVRDVLELACGTGIVTKHLRQRLPLEARLVATDVSEGMLEIARRKAEYGGKVEWQAADAGSLPFPDASFDYVVSQFGVMFFPDKPAAAREAFRVLRPGGRFIFSVWDSRAENDLARIAHETVLPMFEDDPPGFYDVPFGYHDVTAIRSLLREAGFMDVALTELPIKVSVTTARDAATGFVEGNPIVVEIRERLGRDPAEITDEVEQAISKAYGRRSPFKAHMQAIVASGRKPL